MNVGPVIYRELREESRRTIHYWLRAAILILAIPILVSVLFKEEPPQWVWTGAGMVLQKPTPSQSGGQLFASLNCAIFVLIWILAPIMTADCISRERREGTLGLLFLTPLKALDILIGKGFLHGIRSLSLVIGIVPLLTVPFMLGGVTYREIAMLFVIHCSALLLALSAGLIASTYGRDAVRTTVAAVLLSLLFGWTFMNLHYRQFNHRFNNMRGMQGPNLIAGQPFIAQPWIVPSRGLSNQSFFEQGIRLLELNTGFSKKPRNMGEYSFSNRWNQIWTEADSWMGATGATRVFHVWMRLLGWMFLGSVVFFLAVLQFTAFRLKRQWQEEPPSQQRLWFESAFCSPVFWRSIFKDRLSRQLNRNPIGWLQQFRWHSRLSKWGWCLFLLVMQILLVGGFNIHELASGQALLVMLLLMGMSFSASTSFSEERRNGAMELLLVTPLTEGQVIWGRVKGLWSQFLPGLILIVLVWAYFKLVLSSLTLSGPHWVLAPNYLPILVGSYCILPFVGLWFSMKSWPLIAAWILSFLTAVSLPAFLVLILRLNHTGFLLVLQGVLGWIAYASLKRSLVTRTFVIQ